MISVFFTPGSRGCEAARRWLTLRGPQAILNFPHTRFEGTAVGACLASLQHFRRSGPVHSLPAPLAHFARRRCGAEVFSRERSALAAADVHRALALSTGTDSRFGRDSRAALLCVVLGELQGRAESAPALTTGQSSQRSLAVEVEGLLRRDFSRSISVVELASLLGTSFGSFRSNLRLHTGVSPARFIRDLRMREAQRLLRDTDLPTKEIAQLVGYREMPHLYRTFRAHSGSTPTQFRAALKRFG